MTRKTHQGEESDNEAKEQANVILWQMGEASDRVKGYVARTIGEGFGAPEPDGLGEGFLL